MAGQTVTNLALVFKVLLEEWIANNVADWAVTNFWKAGAEVKFQVLVSHALAADALGLVIVCHESLFEILVDKKIG